VVICLEQSANDLHMVQLMPLPCQHLLLHKNPEWSLANVNSCSHSLYAVAHPSVCLSVVCLSVTLVHPTQLVEIFGNFLRHLVPWPSNDIHGKFYKDRPGEPLHLGI